MAAATGCHSSGEVEEGEGHFQTTEAPDKNKRTLATSGKDTTPKALKVINTRVTPTFYVYKYLGFHDQ